MGPLKAIKFKISAHHLGRVGLLGIALATAAAVFAIALVIRLLIGPISLGPFDSGLRSSLNRVLPGLTVRFDDAALEWSRDEGRLNLVVLGARVLDEDQRIIAQAPEAEVGLALLPFLKGHVVVERITLVGVQLTLVHARDGALRLGIDGGQNQSDVLQKIRDAIAHSGGGTASLESFAVNKARLAFYEQQTGAFVISPNANLQITKGNGAPGAAKGTIKASVDADIEISGKPAKLEAVLHLPAKGDDVTGDISVSGLTLSSLASNAKIFGFFAPFDMQTDITGNFALAHGTQLRSADFGIGAAGTVNGLGKPLHVRSFRVTGRYDGVTGRLLIDDATLAGIQANAHLTGQGDLAFDSKGALSTATMSLQMDKLAFNMPGVMGHSVSMAHAAIRGSYVVATRTVSIDQALVFGGTLSAKFTGRVPLADNKSPEIDMDGSVAALNMRDLLHFWPLQIGGGARSWIDANVSAGRIGPILVHTHILPGALDDAFLPENALSVSFPVTGATITYIRGLTPLTNANGTATLSGDTFTAGVDSAAIGPLNVSGGRVVIPNLHLHGAVGEMGAHIDGTVPQVLALIDQKPLRYPTRFQIRSATAKGNAAVDLDLHVPMLHDIKVDNVGISIRVATSELSLALSDHLVISNGNVKFDVGNKSLRAVGNVGFAGSTVGIDWTEMFTPVGPVSTRLNINGQFQNEALAALGFDPSEYLSGPLGITGELDGYRGKMQRAQLKVDLTPSAAGVKALGYSKPAGTAAQAQLNLHMDAGGNVRTAEFELSGAALAAHGSARFSAAGSLQGLDIPSFKNGANDDFALSLTRDPVQGLTVSLTGHSFDEENLLSSGNAAQPGQPAPKTPPSAEPYRIGARLDRVVMREGVVLSPFVLNASGAGSRPKSLALSASLSKTVQVTGGLSNGEDGAHLRLSAGDAGLLVKGLFGSTSLKGGAFSLDAVMANLSPDGDPLSADYAGKFTITNCTVLNQPFLMKLFAAGSFDGLAALMGQKGVQLDSVDVPFTLHGNVLTVREARASANALGLTADGYYDLKTNKLALQGAFTPLYGINGIVSSVPVIGSLLGSKKGEGFIGVTYTASGDAGNPDVGVNPLSMLTPGILRRVFQGSPPTAASNIPPVPQPKPQQQPQ